MIFNQDIHICLYLGNQVFPVIQVELVWMEIETYLVLSDERTEAERTDL